LGGSSTRQTRYVVIVSLAVCLNLKSARATVYLLIVSLFVPLATHAIEPEVDAKRQDVVPGKYFVRFSPALALAAGNDLEKLGHQFQQRIDPIQTELWTFPKKMNVSNVIKEVKAIPGVVAVEPVYMRYLHADYTDDGKDQWALGTMDVVQSWKFVQNTDAIIVAVRNYLKTSNTIM